VKPFLGEPFEVLGVAPYLFGRRLRERGVAAVAPSPVGVAGVSLDGRDACFESHGAKAPSSGTQGDASEVAGVGPGRRGVPTRPCGGRSVVESLGSSSPRSSGPGGGNGRRGRLKMGRPHGRVRSNPTPGLTSIASSGFRASRACSASQVGRILPTQAKRRVGGGKAGYKPAANKVRRGSSDRTRVSARRTFASEPHSRSRTDSKKGRVGAPALTSVVYLSANRADGLRPGGKEGRGTGAAVLTLVVGAVANRVGGLRDECAAGRVGAPVLTFVVNPTPILTLVIAPTAPLSPLMSMIVLPYHGPAAARRERARPAPAPVPVVSSRVVDGALRAHGDPLRDIPMRLTYRTARVLEAIAEQGVGGASPSNRIVAERAGVCDQGQMSKLVARLQQLGLIENVGAGHAKGAANVWELTTLGERVTRQLAPDTDDQLVFVKTDETAPIGESEGGAG
jgi:hypothetical protein